MDYLRFCIVGRSKGWIEGREKGRKEGKESGGKEGDIVSFYSMRYFLGIEYYFVVFILWRVGF